MSSFCNTFMSFLLPEKLAENLFFSRLFLNKEKFQGFFFHEMKARMMMRMAMAAVMERPVTTGPVLLEVEQL